MTSFTAKRLRVTLILAGTNAVFPGTNSNTLVLENLRVSASVQATARLAVQADIQIFGMVQKDMNAASVIWANPPIVHDHLVILEANATGRENGWTQVFKGTVIEAQPDYRGMPDVSFTLLAMTGYAMKINFAKSTSYPFEVDIGVAAADIVEQMGAPWVYVDGGADGVLTNPYFYGPLWDQLEQACRAAKADFYIQGDQVLITKQGQPRDKAPAVVLEAGSGLIGYPMFERAGLNISAIYDPAFACGTPIDLRSSPVPQANGRWYPISISHKLESRVQRGVWISQLQCLRVLV